MTRQCPNCKKELKNEGSVEKAQGEYRKYLHERESDNTLLEYLSVYCVENYLK